MVVLDNLTTERRNPNTMNLDEMSPEAIVAVMNDEDQHVIDAIQQIRPQIAEAIRVSADSFNRGGRIVYIGAGTSGRLGVLDAAECVPTFGTTPDQVVGLIAGGERAFLHAVEGAEDNPLLAEADLKKLRLSETDVVVGLAASGRTPYVCGGLRYARRQKSATIAVSCTPQAEISHLADVAIEAIVGPEVLTGSTRLKAGTAQKMILNMLSTGIMVQVGKTYSNLMVDVVQTNEKLVSRAQQIVMEATGCDLEIAKQAIADANGRAKVAIVMILLNCDADQAIAALDLRGGKIRSVLPPKVTYRPYQPSDNKALLALYNRIAQELHYVPMTEADWNLHVVNIPEFEPTNVSLAFVDGKLVGSSLAVVQTRFAKGETALNTPGYIAWVMVAKEFRRFGIGSALLKMAEEKLRQYGKTSFCMNHRCPVKLSWFVDDHGHVHNKTPGIMHGSSGFDFLVKHHYFVESEQVAYYRDLRNFQIVSAVIQKRRALTSSGYYLGIYQPKLHHGFEEMFSNLNDMKYLKRFQDDCQAGHPQLIVADVDGRICGTAGWVYREANGRGAFGGLAVDPTYGGQGLGTILFNELCVVLKNLGAEYMSIFVTKTNFARKIYDQAGFCVVSEWAMMRKDDNHG